MPRPRRAAKARIEVKSRRVGITVRAFQRGPAPAAPKLKTTVLRKASVRSDGGGMHKVPSQRPPGRARARAVKEAARAEEKGQCRDGAEGPGRTSQ